MKTTVSNIDYLSCLVNTQSLYQLEHSRSPASVAVTQR